MAVQYLTIVGIELLWNTFMKNLKVCALPVLRTACAAPLIGLSCHRQSGQSLVSYVLGFRIAIGLFALREHRALPNAFFCSTVTAVIM